jgi:uncharacterized protein (DUF486 family)
VPLWKVIVASRVIAFFAYCFQAANRFGSQEFDGALLETIQEMITLTVVLGSVDPISGRAVQRTTRRVLPEFDKW